MRRAICAAAVLAAAGVAISQAPGRPGAMYRAPAGNLKDPVLWAGQCEQPEGGGLAFSGQSQTADDGRPHTRIKVDGQWKPIAEELRKANPLQKQRDELWALRTRLKDAAAKARHIFFEGRPEAEEAAYLNLNVNPELGKLAGESANVVQELHAASGYRMAATGDEEFMSVREYEAGQLQFARTHVIAAAGAIKPIAGRVTPEVLAALRQAQQRLEIAADALDAEPPPRACSPIVYDATTKLYIVFGGDHFDYLTNDTWVFDPARRRWMQRHPASAPPPRADHQLTAAGDGKVKMSGGYTYTSSTRYAGDQHIKLGNQYAHLGDEPWTYDVAKDAWTGPAGADATPPDSRVYRTGAYTPEHFMQGDRPDAAANEAKLKALPANVWTPMNVPQLLFLNRDWGTVALDTDRDMLLYWSGGHCVHGGSDVPHYHLATNRWELPFPIEQPIGFIGCSGVGVGGRNFNGRPWMSNHTWKAYVYDSQLKKVVVVGRNHQEFDRYTYLYDPDRGDWTERFKVPDGMNTKPANVKVCVTPQGILAWTLGSSLLYLLDRSTLVWSELKFEGELPKPQVDGAGLIYDAKRDRVLFVRKDYGGPFGGQIYALDMKGRKVTALSPRGMDRLSGMKRSGSLREIIHDPASDLFLWANWLEGDTRMLGYDPSANCWVGVKVQGPAPFSVSTGMVYDPKRKLVWLVHGAGKAGEMFVMRFDAASADPRPITDLPSVAPSQQE